MFWLIFALGIQQTDDSLAQYAPLKTSFKVEVIDTSFVYGPTERSVPLRIYLPETDSPVPVILFSHGLGGTRKSSPFFGTQWSERGYCVVYMQHAGNDRDAMKNAARFQTLKALNNAVNSAFWDAYLKQDPEAISWLKGEAVRIFLGKKDEWSNK